MRLIKKGWLGFGIFAALLLAVVAVIVIVLVCTKPPAEDMALRLPIILYHDIQNAPEAESNYIVSTATLKNDIEKMLTAGFQPISMSQLLSFVREGTALPDKPVLLSFDDGYKSIETQVLPLLEQYKVPACVSVIGARAEAIDDGCDPACYMLWADIRAAAKSPYMEFLSHSSRLHVYRARKGLSMLPEESAASYKKMLVRDIREMQGYADAERFPLLPVFAYPYGYVEGEAEAVFREQGFAATLTSEEYVNLVVRDPECLYQLGRLNRAGDMTADQLLAWMQLS